MQQFFVMHVHSFFPKEAKDAEEAPIKLNAGIYKPLHAHTLNTAPSFQLQGVTPQKCPCKFVIAFIMWHFFLGTPCRFLSQFLTAKDDQLAATAATAATSNTICTTTTCTITTTATTTTTTATTTTTTITTVTTTTMVTITTTMTMTLTMTMTTTTTTMMMTTTTMTTTTTTNYVAMFMSYIHDLISQICNLSRIFQILQNDIIFIQSKQFTCTQIWKIIIVHVYFI